MNQFRKLSAYVAAKSFYLRRREDGQGTTEYAVLVGVLVVIAVVAITLFKPKINR